MTTRRFCREWAVQFLFQHDFNSGDTDRSLGDFWALQNVDPESRPFVMELIQGVLDHLHELDERIQTYADNWDVRRMNAVDRNVMRLALFEMLFRPDVPPVVSINEAVDIAKRFSSNESGKFVNGILDRARKDLNRPSREASARTDAGQRTPDTSPEKKVRYP
ncbi:MAG: transcription antitermination factor NusB [Kiritimatiellae bacterium]|nr:transcription antitermination factor NusB [Kiritimatiellia bacterium]